MVPSVVCVYKNRKGFTPSTAQLKFIVEKVSRRCPLTVWRLVWFIACVFPPNCTSPLLQLRAEMAATLFNYLMNFGLIWP